MFLRNCSLKVFGLGAFSLGETIERLRRLTVSLRMIDHDLEQKIIYAINEKKHF